MPFSFEGGILFFLVSLPQNDLWDGDMGNKTAFIGHRKVLFGNIEERLKTAIDEQIADGCLSFTMGTHGEFDEMALSACRSARRDHPDIKIEVVLISYHTIEKKDEYDSVPYSAIFFTPLRICTKLDIRLRGRAYRKNRLFLCKPGLR